MSRARVRFYALISSALTLGASLIFSIAVTRKLPLLDLGYLNVFSGAIYFGLVPVGISSFMSPRLAAKYRHVQVTVLLSSMLLGLAGMAIAGIFLFLIHSEIPARYFYFILLLALLSVFSSSLNSPFSGGLTVLNRSRMVFTSIITSLVKLVAIFYIFYSHWSLLSVLVSTFVITLSGVVYSGISLVPYIQSFGKIRTTLKEFLSGSWIAMFGYASSNLRSVDTFMIAAIGGILDNAGWQVLNIIGSIYAFRGMLINLTYGELLQLGSYAKRAYFDFLLLMFTTADLAIFVVAFEPNVIEFLRPENPYLTGELFLPVVLWAGTNIINSLSQYISAAMQGTDRVDMEKELTIGTYWKSAIFYANLAEFVMTVTYIALIIPFVFLAKAAQLQFYALDGVILSSAVSLIIAIVIRAKKFPGISEFLPARSIMVDFVVPLAVTAGLAYVIRVPLIAAFPPSTSIITGIVNLLILLISVSAIYLGVSLAISKNIRKIAGAVLKRIKR
ncbi:MAG: hypothetical protein JRN01_06185 [Nitrososphaerota archaeon]|nr:hypothetical protein [Nitrososphaerota archaeon]